MWNDGIKESTIQILFWKSVIWSIIKVKVTNLQPNTAAVLTISYTAAHVPEKRLSFISNLESTYSYFHCVSFRFRLTLLPTFLFKWSRVFLRFLSYSILIVNSTLMSYAIIFFPACIIMISKLTRFKLNVGQTVLMGHIHAWHFNIHPWPFVVYITLLYFHLQCATVHYCKLYCNIYILQHLL